MFFNINAESMLKFSIEKEIAKRILVLDGGLGTMVQGYALEEEDYRGERFRDWQFPVKGCNDVLVLTRPQVIERIHEAYILAGADIITTDTFNANNISLADYGLEKYSYEINFEAARVARRIADKFTLENPSKPRFVAGSIGPTNRTASISPDVNNPGCRSVTFDDLRLAYGKQVKGLIDGGVDVLLVETVFDTLNAKAALFAIEEVCREKGVKIPLMVSGTLTDASGRTLSGQTVEAFYVSMSHAPLLSIGLNCGLGAEQMYPYLIRLSEIAACAVSCHPNAGLPNGFGGYDETPQMMAAAMEQYLKEGLLNIVGGCCGTTPAHIGAIAQIARKYQPRVIPPACHESVFSGLEELRITPETNFVNIGERTNVAGSAKFARMIREHRYDDALSVAKEQVEGGAQIIDICMDDGMIEGVEAMRDFLNLVMAEPEIARVPVMIDSSKWEVLVAGLKCVQGKSIVNSISLKEGETEFLRRAKLVHRYGAAAVVMLFDEKGQSDLYERKIEVAGRAYKLLTEAGFPPEDIIFDPNVLAVATGIEQHNSYGLDFIRACKWIKENCPYAKVSGGVSNLSFSFRGNNAVREAMHSVFLYHAIANGMDMGIVNPSMLQVYSEIPQELLTLCEDVVLNRTPDATEKLTAYAERIKGTTVTHADDSARLAWRNENVEERIKYAMLKGNTDFIDEDTEEAYRKIGNPLGVIDGPLMAGMSRVGELFGSGKMFLPQVVKSARVMKRAVAVLTPYIESERDAGHASMAGKILLATVKGDVHDIGKNIVSVVMACNGYEIEDLGVMVETDKIITSAKKWGADVICLSGLITPSLEEMAKVISLAEKEGVRLPIVIGGATTSDVHTAVKLAPLYSGMVVHSKDASDNVRIVGELLSPRRDKFEKELKDKQQRLREDFARKESVKQYRTLENARANRFKINLDNVAIPLQTGKIVFKDYPLKDIRPYINWTYFFSAWGLAGRYPGLFEHPEKGEEARKVYADAQAMLDEIVEKRLLQARAVVALYHACSDGDDIVLYANGARTEELKRLPQLRNQQVNEQYSLSLADFVAPVGSGVDDYVGAFAVSAGFGLDDLANKYRREGDDYRAIMAKLLTDRLTEAFAEVMHKFVRTALWGYEKPGDYTTEQLLKGEYRGIRPAFGYPSSPDHSMKKDIFELMGVEEAIGMKLTENYMIYPGESVCGLFLGAKEAKNFSVDKIDEEQLKDYVQRRGCSEELVRRMIPQHIR